jgi:ABC-2 type transport system ATP-binding protein
MPEVQEIADRIAIIDKGRLAAIGTEEELLGYVTDRKSITIRTGAGSPEDKAAAATDIGRLAGVKSSKYARDTDEVRVDVGLELANISPILKVLTDRNITVRAFEEEAPNLETTFLALTGSELNADEAAGAPDDFGTAGKEVIR